MNTGLRGVFNGFSVEIFLKNDSSPQIANLARINTGIAEMLFRRAETPKGIETEYFISNKIISIGLEEQKPQRGLKPGGKKREGSLAGRLEEQKPQRGLKLHQSCHSYIHQTFGRTETPKGIETQILLPDGISHMFRRAETPKGIETPVFPSSVSLADVWKDRNPKGDLT